jgi:hypothetical protein
LAANSSRRFHSQAKNVHGIAFVCNEKPRFRKNGDGKRQAMSNSSPSIESNLPDFQAKWFLIRVGQGHHFKLPRIARPSLQSSLSLKPVVECHGEADFILTYALSNPG